MKKITFYIFLILGFALTAKNVLADGFNNSRLGDYPMGGCIADKAGDQSGIFLRGGDGHMGYMMSGGSYIWFGWIFALIFWVLIIAGIAWGLKYFLEKRRGEASNEITKKEELPLEILKTRYAKGEIDKVEYDKIKKDLE